MKVIFVVVVVVFGVMIVFVGFFVEVVSKYEEVMVLKIKQWDVVCVFGFFGGFKFYKVFFSIVFCRNGKVGEYFCNNVNFQVFFFYEDFGFVFKVGNDVWGWIDKKFKCEFGIVGQIDGVVFVEIIGFGCFEYIGCFDIQIEIVLWRDIKVIGDYVYIGVEVNNYGIQIFDFCKFFDVKFWWNFFFFKFKVFSKEIDIIFFDGVGVIYNIVVYEEINMIYVVGGCFGVNVCNIFCVGGMFMVDVFNFFKLVFFGCIFQDGYVYDVQCVIYKGFSVVYKGCEICFNFNEDIFIVMDVINKLVFVVVFCIFYEGNVYFYQGWFIDENQFFFFFDDEFDEQNKVGFVVNGCIIIYIFNVVNFEVFVNIGYYQFFVKFIDYN